MERYAVNETALCGFITSYGTGAAAQGMASNAVPTLMIHARPLSAVMNMTASGAGLLAKLGRGLASMLTVVHARGYLLLCGVGQVAAMTMSALADGRLIPVARGTAVMAMRSAADGMLALLGRGTASQVLDGSARSTVPTLGQGDAGMDMTGSLGIPRPMRTPAQFYHTHTSRLGFVERRASSHAAANPAGERTFVVPAEARTVHVSPQRDI
jgi:hypothetical protein